MFRKEIRKKKNCMNIFIHFPLRHCYSHTSTLFLFTFKKKKNYKISITKNISYLDKFCPSKKERNKEKKKQRDWITILFCNDIFINVDLSLFCFVYFLCCDFIAPNCIKKKTSCSLVKPTFE